MKVEEKNFIQLSKFIQESEKPVILFVCKKKLATRIFIRPILKDLRFTYREKIIFYDIKGELHLKLKEQYAIYQNPTFLFFKKGKLVFKLEGFVNRWKLFTSVKKLVEDLPVHQKV